MSAATPRRRFRPTRIAAVLLLVVPIIEVMALIGVGKVIGGWPTFLLLVAMSAFGAWLVGHEGSRAWRALTDALRSGRMPARELADGMLVLVGGTLLLTPGFLTDVVGFFLILPMTRPVARRLLEAIVSRRLLAEASAASSAWQAGLEPGARRPKKDDDVIEGEVID
ncbi:MAG TPA: FxsA family protein [Dermatophilaceae bacterium]|nr:FxsA family protein [Dermatophilaceae bacterium]